MLRWFARGRSANALGLLPFALLLILLPVSGDEGVVVAGQVCVAVSIALFGLFCLRLWRIKPASDRTWSAWAAGVVSPMIGLFLLSLLDLLFPALLGDVVANAIWFWLYAPVAVVLFTVFCVLGYLKTRDLDHLGLLLTGYVPIGISVLVVIVSIWVFTHLEPVP